METVEPTLTTDPTEESPLLGERTGHHAINGDVEASHADHATSNASGEQPVAQKMHLLIPAVGIGVGTKYYRKRRDWTD